MNDEPAVPFGIGTRIPDADDAQDPGEDAMELCATRGEHSHFALFPEFTGREIRYILSHATEYTVKHCIIKRER